MFTVPEHSCPTAPLTDIGDVTLWKRPRRWIAWKLVCLAERIYCSVYEQEITVTNRRGENELTIWINGNLYGEGITAATGLAGDESDESGDGLIRKLPYGYTVTVSPPYTNLPCECTADAVSWCRPNPAQRLLRRVKSLVESRPK